MLLLSIGSCEVLNDYQTLRKSSLQQCVLASFAVDAGQIMTVAHAHVHGKHTFKCFA